MQFECEIPVDEYAAAQVLYYKAYAKGKSVKRALGWILLGLFFCFHRPVPTVCGLAAGSTFPDRCVVHLWGNRRPVPQLPLSSCLPDIRLGRQELSCRTGRKRILS